MNSIKRSIIYLNLLLFIFILGFTNNKPIKIMGIPISKQSNKFLKEVETLYKKPMCIKNIKDIDNGCSDWKIESTEATLANSGVSSDGTPTIILGETHKNETVLVHELFHLKMYAQGFPSMRAKRMPIYSDRITVAFGKVLDSLIGDTIHHWYFYPKMKKMGLNPNQETYPQFKDAIKDNNYNKLQKEDEWLFVPLFYFKACLETNDPKLTNELRAWYKRKNWDAYLVMGDNLVELVKKSNNPLTPQSAYNIYLDCANMVCKNRFKLEPCEWIPQIKGNYVEHIAPFWITPIN